jgi:hypothetical protein
MPPPSLGHLAGAFLLVRSPFRRPSGEAGTPSEPGDGSVDTER